MLLPSEDNMEWKQARKLRERYKLLYSSADRARNRVKIVIGPVLKDNIVNMRRILNRVLSTR